MNLSTSFWVACAFSICYTARLEAGDVCNAPMIDPFYYNGGGTEIFIRIGRVKNPFIGANNFIGHPAFAIDKRGTGIRSYDAGYTVRSAAANGQVYNPANPPVPNVFTDLSQGIDVYAKGGAASTILIKDNEFNNVYQGITASGSNFSEISFNIFNTPMGVAAFNSWAMYLNTSSGFLATENTMNTLGTNEYTFGVVTKDVDLVMSEVYKNDFNGDFQSANQIEGGTNDEIQIKCNNYQGTNMHDWTVISSSLVQQGECTVIEDPASNIFSVCTWPSNHIYGTTIFDYYTNSDLVPVCTASSGVTAYGTCDLYNAATDCPPVVTDPCPSCVVALGQQVDFLPPGLERKKVKGEYVRRLAQQGDVQDLIDFLVNEGATRDRKVLIPTHLQRNEFTDARNELNLLDQTTYENQKYYELFDVLTYIGEDGRELDSITLSEKQVIESIANTNTQVSIHAQAVLAELDMGYYIRFPEQVVSIPEAMTISNDNTETTEDKLKNVSVYPNPSEGDVVIEFEKASQSTCELLDVMGKEILSFETDENQRMYRLSTLSHGVYMLVIHYLEGNTETKRIIVE